MTTRKILNSLLPMTMLALGFALTGCNDDSSKAGSGESASATAALSVSPSLGFVRNADVRVLDLAGKELAKGRMDDSGSITFPLNVKEAFIIELSGNDIAFYYDEGLRAWRPLPAGTILHAVSPVGRGAIAVTALTEIAYQRALKLAGAGTLSIAHITQANAELAAWLARVPESIAAGGLQVLPTGVSDILVPAQPVAGGERLSSSTAAGRYAILLASLAQQAYAGAVKQGDRCVENSACSPLLALIAYIATDFADGVLDNRNPHGGHNGLPFIDPSVDPVDVYPEAPTAPGDDLTPQQEIGREFSGTYSLSCAGSNKPVTMMIAADGAMTLSGAGDTIELPYDDLARSSPLVEHAYRITPTGKAFTARIVHIEPGILRDVNGMQAQSYTTVVDMEINAHVSGSVQIKQGKLTANCTTTFTQGELQPPIPYFTDILYSPDFICTQAGGGPLRLGTLSFGPTSFLKNGVLQPVRHGDVHEYKHAVSKWRPTDIVSVVSRPVTNNESYSWGTHATLSDIYLSLGRAALRWQGFAHMDHFDMQSTDNWQGMTNCSPEGPQFAIALYQGNGIVMDFGDTELSL